MSFFTINITTFTTRSAFLAVLVILAEIRRLIMIVTSRVAASVWCRSAFDPVVVNLGRNNFASIVPPLRCIHPKISERFYHYKLVVHVVKLLPLKFLFGSILEAIQEIEQ